MESHQLAPWFPFLNVPNSKIYNIFVKLISTAAQ